LGRRPLGAILHSSNEPGELSQRLCHDDSTINIVLVIIIIIIIDWPKISGMIAETLPISSDSFMTIFIFIFIFTFIL